MASMLLALVGEALEWAGFKGTLAIGVQKYFCSGVG
jgi:hypothetical protein